MASIRRAGRWILIEVVGWALVLGGIAALILPGPGVLMLAGGLAVLSQRYEWAARRVEPVKRAGLVGAAHSVATWPRIVLTCSGIAVLIAAGTLWAVGPSEPTWWPLPAWTWLPGGLATSVSVFLSAGVAIGLFGYSYRRFHGDPEALHALGQPVVPDDPRVGPRA
jgi:hypothetical protein